MINEPRGPIPTSDQLDLFHEHTRMTVKEELELLKSIEEYEKAQKANDVQIAGTHYKSKAIQPWDYIVGNNLGYLEGNIVKYVSRWKDKGGVDDLKKARHYLDKLIEVQHGKS
jgi:phage terminase large subunit-like protein